LPHFGIQRAAASLARYRAPKCTKRWWKRVYGRAAARYREVIFLSECSPSIVTCWNKPGLISELELERWVHACAGGAYLMSIWAFRFLWCTLSPSTTIAVRIQWSGCGEPGKDNVGLGSAWANPQRRRNGTSSAGCNSVGFRPEVSSRLLNSAPVVRLWDFIDNEGFWDRLPG